MFPKIDRLQVVESTRAQVPPLDGVTGRQVLAVGATVQVQLVVREGREGVVLFGAFLEATLPPESSDGEKRSAKIGVGPSGLILQLLNDGAESEDAAIWKNGAEGGVAHDFGELISEVLSRSERQEVHDLQVDLGRQVEFPRLDKGEQDSIETILGKVGVVLREQKLQVDEVKELLTRLFRGANDGSQVVGNAAAVEGRAIVEDQIVANREFRLLTGEILRHNEVFLRQLELVDGVRNDGGGALKDLLQPGSRGDRVIEIVWNLAGIMNGRETDVAREPLRDVGWTNGGAVELKELIRRISKMEDGGGIAGRLIALVSEGLLLLRDEEGVVETKLKEVFKRFLKVFFGLQGQVKNEEAIRKEVKAAALVMYRRLGGNDTETGRAGRAGSQNLRQMLEKVAERAELVGVVSRVAESVGESGFVVVPTMVNGVLRHWEIERGRVEQDEGGGAAVRGGREIRVYVDLPRLGPVEAVVRVGEAGRRVLLNFVVAEERTGSALEENADLLMRRLRERGVGAEMGVRLGSPRRPLPHWYRSLTHTSFRC